MPNCDFCGRVFKSRASALNHQCPASINIELPSSINNFKLAQHAFNRFLAVYQKNLKYYPLTQFIGNEIKNIKSFLTSLLQLQSPFKVQFCLKIVMIKPFINSIKRENVSMCTPSMSLICKTDVSLILRNFHENIEISIDQFTQRGSGWTIDSIEALDIRVAKYNQDQGGCVNAVLPREIAAKRACIHINCQSDCFMWSVLSVLHCKDKNPNRVSNYLKYVSRYDFGDVRGVVKLKSIQYFEKKTTY